MKIFPSVSLIVLNIFVLLLRCCLDAHDISNYMNYMLLNVPCMMLIMYGKQSMTASVN